MVYGRNLSMSGPAGPARPHDAFEMLISLLPRGRLASGLLHLIETKETIEKKRHIGITPKSPERMPLKCMVFWALLMLASNKVNGG